MKFNINNYVRVKLNDRGKKILREQHEKFIADNPRISDEFKEFKLPIDDDGWSKWQMWKLFETFGQHMWLGCVIPFETEIEIITNE